MSASRLPFSGLSLLAGLAVIALLGGDGCSSGDGNAAPDEADRRGGAERPGGTAEPGPTNDPQPEPEAPRSGWRIIDFGQSGVVVDGLEFEISTPTDGPPTVNPTLACRLVNRANRAITICTYDCNNWDPCGLPNLGVTLIGPDGVRIMREPVPPGGPLPAPRQSPQARDFVALAPGQDYAFELTLPWYECAWAPGKHIGYDMTRAGAYTISVTFRGVHADACPDALALSWRGGVESNTITAERLP